MTPQRALRQKMRLLTIMNNSPPVFLQIDDMGKMYSNAQPIEDDNFCRSILSHIKCENRIFTSYFNDKNIIIEAFDEPLVALSVIPNKNAIHGPDKTVSLWNFKTMYGFEAQFRLDSLFTDEWDRFHGVTENIMSMTGIASTGMVAAQIPFVLSNHAQGRFFDQLDSFDDDSITFDKKTYTIGSIIDREKLSPSRPGDVNKSSFWEDTYQLFVSKNEKPGWELGEPAKPLIEVLPQLKLPKSKICVLGCGMGHDAAFLATQGHIVIAVDFSKEAIAQAKKKYAHIPQLSFVCGEAFEFAKNNFGKFDIIFEHTFFCAVEPSRRQELAKAWRSMLVENGHLLAIFFAMDRSSGPPYGASEWGIQEHLKKYFDFLYWTRWKTSIPPRLGRELVVYAKRKNLL